MKCRCHLALAGPWSEPSAAHCTLTFCSLSSREETWALRSFTVLCSHRKRDVNSVCCSIGLRGPVLRSLPELRDERAARDCTRLEVADLAILCLPGSLRESTNAAPSTGLAGSGKTGLLAALQLLTYSLAYESLHPFASVAIASLSDFAAFSCAFTASTACGAVHTHPASCSSQIFRDTDPDVRVSLVICLAAPFLRPVVFSSGPCEAERLHKSASKGPTAGLTSYVQDDSPLILH